MASLTAGQREGGTGRGYFRGGRGGAGRLPPFARSGLAEDPCAMCRERGHWDRECPQAGNLDLSLRAVELMTFNESRRGPGESSPAEPLVTLRRGNKEVEFLVYTGATYSVLNTCEGKFSHETGSGVGATAKRESRPFLQTLKFKLGKQRIAHPFLYMPECPLPSMGRDSLSQLDAQMTFKGGEVQWKIPESKAVEVRIFMAQNTPRPEEEIPAEAKDAVIPPVWACGVPGQSKWAEPVRVVLKPRTKLVRQKQYPIKLEARRGLEELITTFLN